MERSTLVEKKEYYERLKNNLDISDYNNSLEEECTIFKNQLIMEQEKRLADFRFELEQKYKSEYEADKTKLQNYLDLLNQLLEEDTLKDVHDVQNI